MVIGVGQVDLLSPLLFIIVLDYVMRKVERAGNGIERVGVGGQQDPA